MQGKEWKSCIKKNRTKLPTTSMRGDYQERSNNIFSWKQGKTFPPSARILGYHIIWTLLDKSGIKGGIHSLRMRLRGGRWLKVQHMLRVLRNSLDPVWSKTCSEHHEAPSPGCTRACGYGLNTLGGERNLRQSSAAGQRRNAGNTNLPDLHGAAFQVRYRQSQKR